MSFVTMRTFPGCWVGRRTLVPAEAREPGPGETAHRCGGCDDVIFTGPTDALKHVVVRCGCGKFNQL